MLKYMDIVLVPVVLKYKYQICTLYIHAYMKVIGKPEAHERLLHQQKKEEANFTKIALSWAVNLPAVLKRL